MKEYLEKLISFKTTHESQNKGEFDKAFDWIIKQTKNYVSDFRLISKNQFHTLFLFKHRKPKVVLLTHIDVVPAEENDFHLKEIKGKFLGRGVYDMKFAIACGIDLIRELSNNSKFALIITSDEEIGGFNGTGFLAKKIASLGEVFIIPDGGYDFNLEKEAKGVLHLKLTFKGKETHAAMPWLGRSAFDEFFEGLKMIRKIFPVVKKPTFKPTLNVGKITGGKATNQLMSELEVFFDIRFPSKFSTEDILNLIKRYFPKASIEIKVSGEAVKVDVNNHYIKEWIKLTEKIIGRRCLFTKSFGASDARFLVPFKVPMIITRPKGGGHHSKKEWIDKKSLLKFKEILKEFILKFS
jgi:succinyl-diaminopimelate desuccinylase